jgi:hypothetical protein
MSVFQTPWKLVGRSGDDFEQIIDADGNVLIEEIGYELGSLIVAAVNKKARFEFEGPHHIYDMVEGCYWIRESQKEIWSGVK